MDAREIFSVPSNNFPSYHEKMAQLLLLSSSQRAIFQKGAKAEEVPEVLFGSVLCLHVCRKGSS